MCVIIQRDPGITLPEQKIWSASKVNADGYGLSIIDRGRIETIREYDPKGNDSTVIMKRLEDAKDLPVFLHLRFRTGGLKNLDNTHPFEVLNHESNGLDMQFMHNGTLSKFNTNKDFSDTFVFNEKILKPLITKFKPYYDLQEDKNILADATIYQILDEYAGYGSIFTIFDGNGNSMIINRSKGVEFTDPATGKKWWASNEYSFNSYHRETQKDDSNRYDKYWRGRYSGAGYGYGSAYDNDGEINRDPFESAEETEGSCSLPPKETSSATEESESVKNLVAGSLVTAKQFPPTIIPPAQRDTFVQLAGISNLLQLTCLEYDDIHDIVANYEEAAIILIMDLIHELYLKNLPKQTYSVPATTKEATNG